MEDWISWLALAPVVGAALAAIARDLIGELSYRNILTKLTAIRGRKAKQPPRESHEE